ncbi:MAG TPA: nitroreductase family deazaflavin-dependent oxidoreductase [Solirubrobacteraceae bacterium]|nr:nitroreductase family deazaflavin-dependent oxidoreductase [Solirubrobacteraceae bacterium]
MSTFKRQADKNTVDRIAQAFAQSRLGGFLFVTVFPALDRRLMPLTGGRLRMTGSVSSLILHVRGAKSGMPRAIPLVYTPRDEDLILIASKAGAPHHPAWYYNLKANPDVEVEIGKRRLAMHARELTGSEREACWALANEQYNGYDTYQQRAGERVIPVVLLEPRR